jgi:multisubunit Na+/H+ antiporter MnhB subunit
MIEVIQSRLLKAAAAIGAGAVASVIWEVAVKPALVGLSGFLMTIGTLGIAPLRDDVYVDVARGLHEDPGVTLVAMALGGLGVVLFFLIRGVALRTTAHADFELASPESSDKHVGQIWQRSAPSNARLNWWLRKALGANIVLLILCTILLARLSYINRAIVHFRQCLDAATPYLSEQEEEEILGQFSSLRTRAEFVTVTAHLERVARTHGKSIPEFTIW